MMTLKEAIEILRNLLNEKEVTTDDENQALSMALVIMDLQQQKTVINKNKTNFSLKM